MPVRSILVPCWPGCDGPNHRLDAALAIARQAGAHIEMVFVQVDPALLAATMPGIGAVAEGLAERVERDNRWSLPDARARFEAWRQRHELPCDLQDGMLRSTFACWSERVGLPEQVVMQKGRLSDLIVLDFPEPPGRALDRVLDAALFETGRPVLLVPRDQVPEDPLRHIAIAWNGSLEATRAMAASLPLLHAAERVVVLTTPGLADNAFSNDPAAEDLDLAAALTWHGVRARHCEVKATDEDSAGAALLHAARDEGASLLVMGAFTHGRSAGAVLGGVTGYMLRHAELPVLMAH